MIPSHWQQMQAKIFTDLSRAKALVDSWKSLQEKVVFTNGCFDVLHPGHVWLLVKASEFGDRLVVGLNSDASVSRLKGRDRPVNGAMDRGLILAAMEMVDAVVVFEEDTPAGLIKSLVPHVLVKGGDYDLEQIAGREEVESAGGRVEIVKLLDGFSTTGLIKKMQHK